MNEVRLRWLVSAVAVLALVVGCGQETPKESAIAVELPGGATMDMVWISPGTFTMGGVYPMWQKNERPPHKVGLTQGFYLGKYEVTQAQWESVMGTRPWQGQAPANPEAPVTYVSWDEVNAYIDKLNQAASDTLYRLPTEAEWEYASRAGITATWFWGASVDTLSNFAWFKGNAGTYPGQVGAKVANPWGLHDMYGNVAEWCADRYDTFIQRDFQEDPKGPEEGKKRVVRGGDYKCSKWLVTSATRAGMDPAGRSSTTGFRLARNR